MDCLKELPSPKSPRKSDILKQLVFSRVPLILLSIATVVIISYVFFVFLFRETPDNKTPKPTSSTIIIDKKVHETPPPPHMAVTRFETDPSGAHIIIDSSLKGETPTKLELPLGIHELILEKDGYYPIKGKIELDESKENFSYVLVHIED